MRTAAALALLCPWAVSLTGCGNDLLVGCGKPQPSVGSNAGLPNAAISGAPPPAVPCPGDSSNSTPYFQTAGGSDPGSPWLPSLSLPSHAWPKLPTACDFNAPTLRAALSGDCDDQGWCWESPLPSGVASHLASLPGATDVWLWSQHGLRRRTGKVWQLHSLPFSSNMSGAFVRTPQDIWASTELNEDGRALIYHFDGSVWSEAGNPNDRYEQLRGTADGALWAKAPLLSDPNERLASWDGSQWTSLDEAAPHNADMTMLAWQPVSAHELWVQRASGLKHYLNGVWQDVPLPRRAGTVQVLLDGSLWLGGADPNNLSVGKLYRYDGAQFVAQALPEFKGIATLGGSGPTDLWLSSAFGDVIHFDGQRFSSPLTAQHPVAELVALGAGDAYALLASASSPNLGGLAHWDATSWDDGDNGLDLAHTTAVWGSAYDDIWAVGASGQRSHFDGRAWTTTEDALTHVATHFVSIWGSARDNVYAVSVKAEIEHYDGEAWSLVATNRDLLPPLASANAVSASSSHQLWLAAGALWYFNGTELAQYSDYMGAQSVQAFAPNDIWVTTQTDLLHYDGKVWSPNGIPAQRVWGTSSNDLWAIQPRSTAPASYLVSHFDGASWTQYPPVQVASGIDYPAYAEPGDHSSALGGCDNYFWVSLGNQLNIFDGTVWTTSLKGGPDISAVWGMSPNALLVGGEGGVMRRVP